MISKEKWQRFIDRQAGDEERKEVVLWLKSLSPGALEELLETGWLEDAPPMPEDMAARIHRSVVRRSPVRLILRWTAAAAIVLAAGMWLLRKTPSTPPLAFVNNSDTVKQWTMADSSSIWLSPHSTAMVVGRLVRLTGEAYFEVHADPAHPFIVLTPGMQTRVLGTHFKIDAYPGEARASVALSEGRVAVAIGDGAAQPGGGGVAQPGGGEAAAPDTVIYLSPGRKLFYYAAGKKLETRSFSLADEAAWKNGALVLDSLPLEDALRKVAARFDRKIVFPPRGIGGNRMYTATYPHPDLHQVLDDIAFVQRLRFDFRGDTLFVKKP